jgi:hypothetical protein
VRFYRDAENNCLDVQAFVYAQNESLGPSMHELVHSWQADGVSSAHVQRLISIIKSLIYSLGVCTVTHPAFAGDDEPNTESAEIIYARTIFNMIRPQMKEANEILHHYVRADVERMRGTAAAGAFDNFSAMQETQMPFGASGFVKSLNTKHLQVGGKSHQDDKNGKPKLRCRFCKETTNGSFQEHNKVCPKRKQ